MRKIIIENTKNIQYLEFNIPNNPGVYLIVGANGTGKTTLLVCLDRICNPNGFAHGFSTSRLFGEVDQYHNSTIRYEIEDPAMCLLYRKKSKRWAVSPKGGSALLSNFGFSQSVFVRADSNRIDASREEIRQGNYVSADIRIKQTLNRIFETTKYNKLKRLRNTNGRGRQATYFYVIEDNNEFYSEKRFSTGELAVLRLVEKLCNVDNNALVLLDEAELALHPRVQKNLLDYLKTVSEEKCLTIFVSTHSVTMIKDTEKKHIILLESSNRGRYEAINPCYPARAIGSVDFMNNIIYDAIFFVEDEMARLLLKKILQRCCEIDNQFSTITNCIVPVGGYRETAKMAINTRTQLFNNTHVFSVWDDDVFSETIPRDNEIREFYEQNRGIIYTLGCTPELWMIEQLESGDEAIITTIRNRFHIDVVSIITSTEYLNCRNTKPRKLAKEKMDVVIQKLSEFCGDSKEIVLDAFAQIIIDATYDDGQIRRIAAPMLSHT